MNAVPEMAQRRSKACTICKEVKPLHSFVVLSSSKDGRSPRCRECHKVYCKASKEGTLKPSTRYDVVWPRECPQCGELKEEEQYPLDSSRKSGRHSYCKVCKARVIQETRDRHREDGTTALYNLKKAASSSGTSVETVTKLNEKIGGKCEICGGLPTGNHGRLALDHNHKTKKFRGLLCGNCNQGLGLFQDNPEFLTKATEYLNERGNYYGT